MITFLEGVLAEKKPARVVLNVGGVGYEVFIPLSSFDHLPKEGQVCRLLIYDYPREDKHDLFGFVNEAERRVFSSLLDVSGIGPRLAMSALSSLSVRTIVTAIMAGDFKLLNGISGVGRKLAERIVIELRDKFSASEMLEAGVRKQQATVEEQLVRDTIMALIALGYKQTEAQKMATAAFADAPKGISVEEIVRKALMR